MNRLDSLTVHDLRVVVVLAEVLHFGKTADHLGIAQPSVSAAVNKAEQAVGTKIFFRTSRKCSVTPFGKEVVTHVKAALAQIEQITGAMEIGEFRGSFRLGLIPTIAPYLLPGLTAEVYQGFPNLAIYFTEGHTDKVLDEVVAYELDAGIISNFTPRSGIESHLLAREELLVAVHRDHNLASQEEIANDSLSTDEMLSLDKGNCLRDQALGLCPSSTQGERPSHSTSLQTLLCLVSAGLGYAIVPRMAAKVASELSNVELRPLESATRRDIVFVCREGDPRIDHFHALMKVTQKILALQKLA
jgi:LysR family hydrogen peroxide-inducible transcriptional activator